MNDPEKRFLFFSSLFLMAFIVGGLVTYQTINFHKVFLITAIGTFVWAMFEHESSLSSKKLYLNFFLYSLLLVALGFICKKLPIEEKELWMVIIASRMLFFFLLVQKILRYIFIKIFKKEPVIDDLYFGGDIINTIYTYIIVGIMIMSPVVIGELYNAYNF